MSCAQQDPIVQQRKEALGSLWMHRMPTYRARIQQICAAALQLPVSAQPFRWVLQLFHIDSSSCMTHAKSEKLCNVMCCIQEASGCAGLLVRPPRHMSHLCKCIDTFWPASLHRQLAGCMTTGAWPLKCVVLLSPGLAAMCPCLAALICTDLL